MDRMPESDWKRFRVLRKTALDRYCTRVLGEVTEAAGTTGLTAHERYRRIYQLIHDRDDDLAAAFDNPRRSDAIRQLTMICRLNLVTDAEVEPFTEATRETLRFMLSDG